MTRGGGGGSSAHLPELPADVESHELPRDRRIRRRTDFLRVQQTGARVGTSHFLILLDSQPGARRDAAARLGIVASRKVGGAVVRNRAKRLVREAYRLHADLFLAGIDYVVIVRAGADRLSRAEVETELCGVSRLLARRSIDVRRRADAALAE